MLVAVMTVFIAIRNWIGAKKGIDLWWWNIDRSDLALDTAPHTDTFSYMQQLSRVSFDTREDNVSADTPGKMRSATLMGKKVRVSPLAIEVPKKNDALLEDFRKIKDISSPNLVQVFGACLELNTPVLVTELCPKGTLQDLLACSDITLVASLKISMARDIAQGLYHLHNLPDLHHGRLSSATCLIDSHLVVKLADFGLPSLFTQVHVDETSEEYQRGWLWKAPELLRVKDWLGGTREGDIYSLGIILSELVSRAPPYQDELIQHKQEDILLLLQRTEGSSAPIFRPSVISPPELQEFSSIMTSAWEEDPAKRPSAGDILTCLNSMAQCCSKNGQQSDPVDSRLRSIECYTDSLENLVKKKSDEWRQEQLRHKFVLVDFVPRKHADFLLAGFTVKPEQMDCVTVGFSSIEGFSNLVGHSTPAQILAIMTKLHTDMDFVMESFDIYKVDSIGDSLMLVSGISRPEKYLHAAEMVRAAHELIKVTSDLVVPHRSEHRLRLKIGLHTGPVYTMLLQCNVPRYWVLGETVDIASMVASSGKGMKIHVSETTADSLRKCSASCEPQPASSIPVRGVGKMKTYWVKIHEPLVYSLIDQPEPAAEHGA